MIFNRQIVRRGTLDGSLMTLCGVTDTEFPDLAGLNSEITLVPIAKPIMPFHDAGLRVKRLKEPSSSAELVLVKHRNGCFSMSRRWNFLDFFENSHFFWWNYFRPNIFSMEIFGFAGFPLISLYVCKGFPLISLYVCKGISMETQR